MELLQSWMYAYVRTHYSCTSNTYVHRSTHFLDKWRDNGIILRENSVQPPLNQTKTLSQYIVSVRVRVRGYLSRKCITSIYVERLISSYYFSYRARTGALMYSA